jgi:hypothetical protein
MTTTTASIAFQALLILNGAELDEPEPGLFGYEPKNIFRRIYGNQDEA